jgi:hypothetical protein
MITDSAENRIVSSNTTTAKAEIASWRELEPFLLRLRDQVVERLDETLHCLLAVRLVVGVAASLRPPNARLG